MSPQKGKEDDSGYHKAFKTSKVSGKKNKEKDSKETKSYGIGYNQETPNGETPDITPGLQISKEEFIKISKEPVANYYTIIKDLGHGSYGQVKKVKHKKLNEIRAMKIKNMLIIILIMKIIMLMIIILINARQCL